MSLSNEFFVTLMSNACTNEFSDNTLSNFSNKLPQNLNFDNLQEWFMSVHSLGVSTKFFNVKTPRNKYLPNFKLIVKVRDPAKAKASTLQQNIVRFGSPEMWHAQFNENKYEKSFIESLKEQPIKFMEVLSHDHNVYSKDKEAILLNHLKLSDIESSNYSGPPVSNLSIEDTTQLYESRVVYSVDTDFIEISFNNDFLTVKQIAESFNIWDKLGVPLKVHAKKKDYFMIMSCESDLFDCYGFTLMIHSNSVKNFSFLAETLRKTKYNGEDYFCKDFNSRHDILVGQSKNWYYNYPEIISVECDQVKEQIHNSVLEKHVAMVCPHFQEKEEYYNFVTEIHNFHPVCNNYLDSISVKLKDLNNSLLSLLPGPATYIKFLFKKMDSSDSFNIKLSKNSNSFETVLPQPVNLDHSWRCTLSSISFPTEYLPLPFTAKNRKMWYVEGDVTKVSTLPNIQYTKGILAQMVNQFFSKIGVNFIVENDRILLSSNKSIKFGFSTPVAHILGFDKELNSDRYPTQHFTYSANSEVVSVELKTNMAAKVPLFHRPINIDYLRPNYLMVYANVIDHCIVGSQYIKLLRIVPVNLYNGNSYQLHEFPQTEYHGLESTYFDSIKIDIRDHAGELVNFIGKKITLNLHFSREQK